MGMFWIRKDKQHENSQERTNNAELAFEMWALGWDGWIASEPVLPAQGESELPRDKVSKAA